MNVPDILDAKEHLDLRSGANDAEVGRQLAAAVAAVEGHVGPLAPRPLAERRRHEGGPLLLLQAPLLSLTSVAPILGYGTLGTGYPVGRFVIDADAGIATFLGPQRIAAGWLEVAYTAGRPAGSLPADLHQAVLEQLRHLWETQRGGLPPRPGDAGMGPRAFTIPRRVEQLVEPYLVGEVHIA